VRHGKQMVPALLCSTLNTTLKVHQSRYFEHSHNALPRDRIKSNSTGFCKAVGIFAIAFTRSHDDCAKKSLHSYHVIRQKQSLQLTTFVEIRLCAVQKHSERTVSSEWLLVATESSRAMTVSRQAVTDYPDHPPSFSVMSLIFLQ